ncbi:MAG: primase-helicase family protein, partial [Dokdonella sp.]|uniref:primase-helicase family protein n=1 Tax=Dokdonella sp. TaxID=2291710 RepID=UPI003F7EC6C6
KLKAFITGTWIRINAKNVAARDERNNVNMVFLSNEAMPVALEEDDRRHAVVWTPGGLQPDFYQAVAAELENGGVAALHDYLLHLDLGDFHENTKPPYTEAKEDLIDLGRDSPTRFHNELLLGNIGRMPFAPCLAKDAYDAYKGFCHDIGVRPAPLPKFTNAIKRKHDVPNTRER